MDIAKIKNLANTKIQSLEYTAKDCPLETLKTIEFDIPFGSDQINQTEIAILNTKLDESSCLGRTAQSIAIIERHHPNCCIQVAEVWEDYFQLIMLKKLHDNHRNAQDSSFMRELLLYEEPHSVLIIDGVQFDPLSVIYGSEVVHPKIKVFSPWESISAYINVSESYLTNSATEKLNILNKADNILPGSTIVAENMVEAHLLTTDINHALRNLFWALEKRPCARTLYCAYLLTKKVKYCSKLINIYTKEIIKYLEG